MRKYLLASSFISLITCFNQAQAMNYGVDEIDQKAFQNAMKFYDTVSKNNHNFKITFTGNAITFSTPDSQLAKKINQPTVDSTSNKTPGSSPTNSNLPSLPISTTPLPWNDYNIEALEEHHLKTFSIGSGNTSSGDVMNSDPLLKHNSQTPNKTSSTSESDDDIEEAANILVNLRETIDKNNLSIKNNNIVASTNSNNEKKRKRKEVETDESSSETNKNYELYSSYLDEYNQSNSAKKKTRKKSKLYHKYSSASTTDTSSDESDYNNKKIELHKKPPVRLKSKKKSRRIVNVNKNDSVYKTKLSKLADDYSDFKIDIDVLREQLKDHYPPGYSDRAFNSVVGVIWKSVLDKKLPEIFSASYFCLDYAKKQKMFIIGGQDKNKTGKIRATLKLLSLRSEERKNLFIIRKSSRHINSPITFYPVLENFEQFLYLNSGSDSDSSDYSSDFSS